MAQFDGMHKLVPTAEAKLTQNRSRLLAESRLYVDTFRDFATELQASLDCTVYEPVQDGTRVAVTVPGTVVSVALSAYGAGEV
jgi:hypothetical protein